MADEGERVRARYECGAEEGESFACRLAFTAEVGLDCWGRPAVHLGLLEGSDFYLRVAAGGLRRGCVA